MKQAENKCCVLDRRAVFNADKGGFSRVLKKGKKEKRRATVSAKCRFIEVLVGVFVVLKLSEKFANVCRMTATTTTISGRCLAVC